MCGLKSFYKNSEAPYLVVAPFAGVWIEIVLEVYAAGQAPVAPFAGVWIEIRRPALLHPAIQGRTLRGCVD